MSLFPFKPDAPNVEVIGVGTATTLNESQLLQHAANVCEELHEVHKQAKPIIRHFVYLGHKDFIGVLVERAGIYTIFIGLGLEVIQALHGFSR